ncbi:poly [ADP-ribose] polymerase-like [Cloeon dipterum]|uniref:poly [ADP-ribose] polymerase-like n=1 Tax=Cloeon dipterum TaxID=197152 RepID=UPI00321F6B20
MTDNVHRPYCAEYAKSGRSKCRGCNALIENRLLRLGICTQLSYWFHKDCFFKRHKPGSTSDILNFNKLRAEDQTYVRANIGTNHETEEVAAAKKSSQDGSGADEDEGTEDNSETDVDASSEDGGKENAVKAKPARRNTKIVGDKSKFMIDYSLSERSTCCSCHEKITKSIVRIARMDYTSNKGNALNGIPRWYHVQCFASNRDFFEFWDGADCLPGFFALKAQDQKELAQLLPEITTEMMIAQGASQWKIQKIASHRLQKLKTLLAGLTVKDYERILKHNKQEIPAKAKKSALLDLLIAAAKHGVVVSCPECKSKGNVNKTVTNLYKCFNTKDGENCTYESLEPPRTELKIPKPLRDEFDFFNTYKFTVQEKSTETENQMPTTGLNINAPEFVPREKVLLPKGPLNGQEFVVIGVAHAKERIKQLGGRVVTFINGRTKAVITNQASIKAFQENNKNRFNYIEQFSTPIVGEEFLEHVGTARLKDLLRRHDMAAQWIYDIGDCFLNEKYGPWGRNWW